MAERPSNDHAFTNEDRRYSRDLEGVDVAVMGVPFDTATTNRPGARFGPRGVRAASANMAWERPYGLDFDPREALKIVDYGDVAFDHGRPDAIPGAITQWAEEIVGKGVTLLSIGGDHFITWPLLQAHYKTHGQMALIHFDAHTDTWRHDDEEGRVDHGTMFYHAAKQGLVDPKASVQIGIRTHNDDTMGFNVLDAPWVHANGAQAVIDKTRQLVGERPVYMTFDIDCLDPAFAPGTGTPVWGGLSSEQARQILRGLAGINIVGMDMVEVAPAYDSAEITALAGAHILCEGLALVAQRPGGPASR